MRASDSAASVPIQSQKHPVNDGVAVCVEDGYGRVLIATRAFSVGEHVLTEWPFVCFSGHDELIKKFIDMSDEDRRTMLDFKHYKDPEDALYETFRETCTSTWAAAVGMSGRISQTQTTGDKSMTAQDVFGVMMVAHINAHSFRGASHFCESVVTGYTDGDAAKSALFPLASKVAHSCAPNCLFVGGESRIPRVPCNQTDHGWRRGLVRLQQPSHALHTGAQGTTSAHKRLLVPVRQVHET